MDTDKGRNIVLRLGARTIECGLEDVGKPLVEFNVHHFAERQTFNTDATNNKLTPTVADDLQHFRHIFYPDMLVYSDREVYLSDLRIHLKKILGKVFYKCGISTINAKLLLLQNRNFPTLYTKLIADILINDLFMRAVVVLPSPLMVCIGSGSSMGIVVDIGWTRTTIVPVYDNRVLQNHTKFTTRAGFRLHYELLDAIKEEGLNPSSLSFRDIENAIQSNDELVTCGPYLVNKSVFDNTVSNIFFKDHDRCEDDEQSIVHLLSALINELPIDLKSQLSSRIIITGGISSLRSFKSKLISEINDNVSQQVSGISTLGDWTGASIYSFIMKHQKKTNTLWEIRKH